MRLTLVEMDILNACGGCYPVASSIAKLVKATGRARNDLAESVDALCAVKYVNKTDKNEVYLLADGRKYLGIDDKPAVVAKMETAEFNSDLSALDVLPNKFVGDYVSFINNDKKQVNPLNIALDPVALTENATAKPKRSVLTSIDDLAKQLNKQDIVIEDAELKVAALTKLAEFMGDDIAELLIDVKDDLTRLCT